MKDKLKDRMKGWLGGRRWAVALSFLIFVGMATGMFLKITYLFRNIGYDRYHIIGIKEEKELDVVYIGGSAAFVYWEAPRAWGEYGIRSYNYATNTIQAEMILGNIREVRKTVEPKLFVIGVRAFQYWSEANSEAGMRNVSDSMDYSWNRWRTVYDYAVNRSMESREMPAYYLDIAKYHTNVGALGSRGNWELSDNRGSVAYNGWEFIPLHEALSLPEGFMTQERKELAEGSKATLVKLLEYCRQEELEVLFVVCPYWITKENKMLYRSMQDMVESYGYGFLDANEYYEEMGIDFSTDFYNVNHVNPYGAEKYTRFLAEYIRQRFGIADCRGEAGTEQWDEMYQRFEAEDMNVKSNIDSQIAVKEDAYQNGHQLKKIENIYKWCIATENGNYTLLMEFQGKAWELNADAKWVLGRWGIPGDNMAESIRVFTGTALEYAADALLEQRYQAGFKGHTDYYPAYELNSGKDGGIWIDGVKCDVGGEGLHVAVYDNNYRELMDSVSIRQTKEGELIIVRE